MTRINVAIPPEKLTYRHLLAEHREIKRIPNLIKSGRYNLNSIKPLFSLGTGHVSFFYNKLKYIHKRYLSIYTEAKRQGYNVTNFEDSFSDLPPELYNDYVPTKRDYKIIKERLISKDPIYLNILE